MTEESFPETMDYLLDRKIDSDNPYVKAHRIPIGTKQPFYEYPGEIPEEEMVYLYFDPLSKEGKEAFNVLLLGASGDGKSLILKNIWYILQKAGYYCIYIDPKSFSSGRAKVGMDRSTNRIAPGLKPDGIKLKHYIPSHKIENLRTLHNFEVYSMRPSELKKIDMWLSLNQTPIASDNILEIVKRDKDVDVDEIIQELTYKTDEKLFNIHSFNSTQGKLVLLKHSNFFNEKYGRIDMLKDFREGYSVCISYRSGDDAETCLDIGEKIFRCNEYSFTENNKNPIMFLLDDASFYTDTDKIKADKNFAVKQIKHIGYNYRENGIFNFLSVQSLRIINESVAESYPIKIISPLFNNPQSLSSIGINQDVIDLIKENNLRIDEKNQCMEWILVFKKKVTRFFPFIPPTGHFKEVYKTKEEK